MTKRKSKPNKLTLESTNKDSTLSLEARMKRKSKTYKGWGIVSKAKNMLILAYPGSKNDAMTQAFSDAWLDTDLKFIDKVFRWEPITITIESKRRGDR